MWVVTTDRIHVHTHCITGLLFTDFCRHCIISSTLLQAHYRRAAANQQYAESGIKKGHTKCIDANGKLEKAMQGYAMAYTLMSDVEQVNFRSQLVCDILIIGLDRG